MKRTGPLLSTLLVLAMATFIALAGAGALRWYPYSPSHDEQRAVQLGLIWIVGLYCLWQFVRNPASTGLAWCAQRRRMMVVIAIFWGIGLISASAAALPAWALLEWSHLFLLMALCITLSLAIKGTPAANEWLYLALVAASLLYLVQVLVLYIAAVFVVHAVDNGVVVVGFAHRRFAAQMHAMLIPMLGALYFQYGHRRIALVRAGLLALAGFAWMLCMVAAARGAGVALVASVIALAFLGRAAWLRWMTFYGLSLLVGICLLGLLFVLLPDWAGATMTWENRLAASTSAPGITDSPGRMFLWTKALKMVVDSPLLGIGPMHFAYEFHNEGSHPHNLPLQLMAEWGPLATLCFVGVVLHGYLRFGRFALDRAQATKRERSQQMTAEGLWAVLTIIAVYALLDGLFVMPYSQMLIVLFAAWAMALLGAESGTEQSASPKVAANKAWRVGLALALAIALFSVATMGFSGIGKSAEREADYERSTGIDFLFPRFLAQGWIGPLAKPAQNK